MIDSSVRHKIVLECLSLPVGQSMRTICPSCNATHEKSFTATRVDDSTILFVCGRVKCGIRGVVGGGVFNQSRKIPKAFRPKVLEEPTRELTVEERYYFRNKYQIISEDIKMCGDRIVISLRDYDGHVWGHTTKDEFKKNLDRPKAMLYREREVPKLAYFIRDYAAHPVVLVEDCISAIKVSRVLPAVALLGTNLGAPEALELRSHYPDIIIALDPDAVAKALKLKNEWSVMFKSVKVVHFPQDPKDTPMRQLRRELL